MIPIEESWQEALKTELQKPYLHQLSAFLVEERKNHTVYPDSKQVFAAFAATPFDKVKVVLVGQDPYHGPGQAHGLSFSVSPGVKQPPSLQNIFKELKADLGVEAQSGYLLPWAQEGVLLLNAFLTVRAGEPLSHHRIGWQFFTDAVIQTLAEHKKNLVFLLWGKFAQEKVFSATDALASHEVLTAAHPSPYSAHHGFFGCRHFSKTNHYLNAHGIKEVNWDIR